MTETRSRTLAVFAVLLLVVPIVRFQKAQEEATKRREEAGV